jgi:winged helix domain-containing protein
MTSTKIKIRLPDGSQQAFVGREAWTLRHLVNAGSIGVTTIDHPAPRWSHYVFKLRKAGLVISTEHEGHKGDFPGTHGRYRLETPVTVIDGGAA